MFSMLMINVLSNLSQDDERFSLNSYTIFVLKLLRNWTSNLALTDDKERKIEIHFLRKIKICLDLKKWPVML